MAALTTFQGRADESEVIPVEKIGRFIQKYEYPARVGLGLVWAKPGQGNIPRTFPRWDELQDVAGATTGVPAGTKAESDQFVYREVPMSEETITPGMVGFRIFRSDETSAEAPAGVPAGMLSAGLEALMDRMDSDLLSSITSLTNTEGVVTDTYNLARFRADLAAFKLLNVPANAAKVAVLSSGMMQELYESLHTSQATLVSTGGMPNLGPDAGYQGDLQRVQIYESQQLPVSTTGRAGVMTALGENKSCLGAVINEMPNVTTTRGDESDSRAGRQYVLRCWYGSGITNPNRGQQILGAA
ncbi:MAG: hypothetical protein ACRBBM_17460 [Pseudomonadaceae bacterium]